MFKIEKKEANKEIVITVGGFFKEEDGQAFLEEYHKNVSSISPSSYKLIVDSRELSASKSEMLPVLEGCFKLYMSNGFNKIIMINPSSVISKMQLKKVAESTGLKCEFVDTI